MMRSILTFACLLIATTASANIVSFSYTGEDYTKYLTSSLIRSGLNYPFTQADLDDWDASLGPHLNITISLDFNLSDVSNITGTFQLDGYENRGSVPDHSQDYIGTMAFSSGLATGEFLGGYAVFADSVVIENNVVTSWQLDFGLVSAPCGDTPRMQCEFQSSSSTGDQVTAYTGYNDAMFSAGNSTSGTWTGPIDPVSGPVVGTGLPGLAALGGLLVWRRRQTGKQCL